ncbi:MAG: AAA family ATPase [Myxococcota bacterium]
MAERIAVTGSAGVGKSTLARRLAAELGVPYIGEGMREYLERTGDNLHALGHERMKALVLRLWEERKEAEAAATTGFVADRAGYDFGAFWLYYQFAAQDADTERLLAEALAPGRYDAVYLLPWGRIPLVADGVRTPNPYTQLHLQLLLEGLLRRHAPDTIELLALEVDERVAEVLDGARARRG